MAKIIIMPGTIYQTGTHTFTSITIPTGLTYFNFYVDMTNIAELGVGNESKTLTLDLDMSLTGNEPYEVSLLKGMVFRGGVHPKNAQPPFDLLYGIQLPSPKLTTRKIKGQLAINDSMNISASVEALAV